MQKHQIHIFRVIYMFVTSIVSITPSLRILPRTDGERINYEMWVWNFEKYRTLMVSIKNNNISAIRKYPPREVYEGVRAS